MGFNRRQHMDNSYSYGGQFQPRGWPFYQPLVIVVQVPAYTDTGMQQRNYRPQTRNCTKNTSRTQKSNGQKRRDQQRRKAFYSWKYVCASMPWYHHSIPGRCRSMTFKEMVGLFVCFVALRPKSTAMVIAGQSVHLGTLFPGQA